MKSIALQLGFGLAFGVVLSRSGFSDWRQLHGMFRVQELNPALAFATVLVVTAPLWLWLRRYEARRVHRPIHPGSIPGGLLFGFGGALCGACPSLALVQLGEGKGLAALTLLGMLLGNYIYARVHERFFRWQSVSCADD